MTLNATAFYVGGITVSSSDQRLKFTEKPLTNALGVINQLKPVEYDQTHDLSNNIQLMHRSLINADAWLNQSNESKSSNALSFVALLAKLVSNPLASELQRSIHIRRDSHSRATRSCQARAATDRRAETTVKLTLIEF